MQLIIGVLVLFFAINFVAIAQGLAIIAIMITGPVMFGIYMWFLSKSTSNNITFKGNPKGLAILIAVLSFSGVSIGSMVLFVMKNPELIF
jgi:hypothetical protein